MFGYKLVKTSDYSKLVEDLDKFLKIIERFRGYHYFPHLTFMKPFWDYVEGVDVPAMYSLPECSNDCRILYDKHLVELKLDSDKMHRTGNKLQKQVNALLAAFKIKANWKEKLDEVTDLSESIKNDS